MVSMNFPKALIPNQHFVPYFFVKCIKPSTGYIFIRYIIQMWAI